MIHSSIPFPGVDEESLVRGLVHARDRYARQGHCFPDWLDRTPIDLLKHGKFIVCGSISRAEIRVLARHANVIAIVDDFLCKTVKTLFGIPVIDSDTWADRARGDASIVSCILVPTARAFNHFSKLAQQFALRTLMPLQFLELLRVCEVDQRGEPGYFFWYGETFFNETQARLDPLLELRHALDDAYSRLSWLCVLSYRMTLNPYFLDVCTVGYQTHSFNLNSYSVNREFFQFTDDEVYVDGGAYVGDSIETFLRTVDGRFGHIHSFEPAANLNGQIRQRLRQLQNEFLKPLAPNVTLHEKGLWDRTTELEFNPSATVDAFGHSDPSEPVAAHLVDSGLLAHIYDEASEKNVSIQVPVTSIDEATDASATFIKFEIEGAELRALQGAAKTIARNRPKMAVSIYHKPEDLETLTGYVRETGQNYKLGFRLHHPWQPAAIVLYCY